MDFKKLFLSKHSVNKISLWSLCALWLILSSSVATALNINDINIPKDVNDVNRTDYATGIIKQDAKAFPKIFVKDATSVFFDRTNLTLLLLAAGGSITLRETDIDERAADHFKNNGRMSPDLDKFVDLAGNPGTHFAATGIWYLMAANKKDDLSMQRSWIMLRALAVTGATTLALKAAVHDHTPNDKDWAWPSGHTSSSFAAAAVLDEFYGPSIGIPAYLGAGFVGYRMMESGDHWASDVLFGGVLGYVIGHTIAGNHKELAIGEYKLQPMVTNLHDRPAAGIALEKRF
ncbi:MAG: phosphatase PAP2 family protein [Phycisphaerales bacterium]